MSNNCTILRRSVFCLSIPAWLTLGAGLLSGQLPEHGIRPLVLGETRYSLRAGEPVRLDAPVETVSFLRAAKIRRLTTRGASQASRSGFVVGPNVASDGILLAASLTMPPGEYTVEMSAIGETGEERLTSLAVTLNPPVSVPSTATQPPVILLNGYQSPNLNSFCPPSASSATFGRLQAALTGSGVPVVYFFDNCVEDPNSGPIEGLGQTLRQVLNLIKYENGALVPQVDLVSHSMGGLIVRAYLAGLQANGALSPPPNPRVRKFVEIAAPNFGSYLAANGSFFTGQQGGEMIPGSQFLWNLSTWNQWSDDLRGVDALAIVGDLGTWTSSIILPTNLPSASDGVVSVTSASLGFARDSSRTRILHYCHADSPIFGMNCTGPGIAKASETEAITVSFLGLGGGRVGNRYLVQMRIVFYLTSVAHTSRISIQQVRF